MPRRMQNGMQGGAQKGVGSDLSDEATEKLIYIIQEEKLAGDIYDAFSDMYDLRIFENIAKSEDRHFSAVMRQADRLDIDVSDLPSEAGVFADQDLQALYNDLLAQGSASLQAALEVGVFIEETDIDDLVEAQAITDDRRLDKVYDNLLAGSEKHLAAFQSHLDDWVIS
ncbi:MAG: DUF2202 domain-containing protein [Rhodospirillales bacterium]|nr:DUF2202 domain-containing protein [Rhodospirillales bacterium]